MSDSSSHDSFEAAVRPHCDRLYRLAYRLTGARPDAEDLVQDTLINVFARRAELSGIRELAPWLGRVLFNQFIDDKRRYRRRIVHLVEPGADPDDGAGPADARYVPDLAVVGDERSAALSSALAELSEAHRVVLVLHDVEEYKLKEIQELTDTPVGTLKSRLHRARARLREILARDGTFRAVSTCNGVDGAKTDAL